MASGVTGWFRKGRATTAEPSTPPAARLRQSIVETVRDHLDGRDEALVVVLGARRAPLLSELRAAGPRWTVVEAATNPSDRHVQLARLGPVDVVVDSSAVNGRLRRFRSTFFHLRPGGLYLVPTGASELGEEHGALGELLAAAAARKPRAFGGRRQATVAVNLSLALRMHVTTSTIGPHLALTHDLPDVLCKLDEREGTAWIRASENGHRVREVLPAEPPADARVITDGPVQRKPAMDRPITAAPICLRDYRDVTVDVEQVVTSGRVVLPDTYRHNQNPVLRSFGIIDIAPRHGLRARPLPAELPVLRGTLLHLDNEIRGHFGHTITEVLSRMWSWPAALEIDPDTRVLLSASRRRPEIAEWEYQFYEACGIPRDRIVRIEGPVRVERLLSGSPMFSNPQFVHPGIVETWDRVGDALVAQTSERDRPARIFIGRRTGKRACANASEVEAIFGAYGFDVVYPEDHPLGEQVAMFRAADVVAGYAGSGMFHIAFVPHPLQVIEIGSRNYRARNEVLMAAVRGHRIDAVVSEAEAAGFQSAFTFDLERDGSYLRSILDGLPPVV